MLEQKYVDYIMSVSAEVGVNFKEYEVKMWSFEKYQDIADELDKLYKLHQDNQALDMILDEVKEFGTDYVKKKYLAEGVS